MNFKKVFTLRNSKGFTLIELLVVVAIIGLLSSIVFASLKDARAKGRDAKRKSDLIQIRNAIALYQSDNNGAPPRNDGRYRAYISKGSAFKNAVSKYLKKLPSDPISKIANTSKDYTYKSVDRAGNYLLCTNMEVGSGNGNSFSGCPPNYFSFTYCLKP